MTDSRTDGHIGADASRVREIDDYLVVGAAVYMLFTAISVGICIALFGYTLLAVVVAAIGPVLVGWFFHPHLGTLLKARRQLQTK